MGRFRNISIIVLISFLPTFFIWLPFFLKIPSFWGIPLPQNGMATIVSNYDGPLYLVVAKTLYNIDLIKTNFQFPLPTQYYASHFPLFPILIRLLSPIFGFPYSMLVVTVSTSFLALYFFNKLMKLYVSDNEAMFITIMFSVFPARWLISRSVGSPEPLFLAGIIASLYYFQKEKFLLAGIWGAVAQLTKSPGILLFAAYLAATLTPYAKNLVASSGVKFLKSDLIKKIYPSFLIPLALISVFLVFKFTYNDLWAYFHSGNNLHLFFPPFQIFNYSQPWVGTFWLEEVIFVYFFGILGLLQLIKQRKFVLAWFVGIFFFSTIFISHRDLIRYSLPIVPFLFVAFSESLVKKEFKLVIFFLAIPIYLFSIAFISQNVMPISNWAPFL